MKSKQTKKAVHYRLYPNAGDRCGNCVMFEGKQWRRCTDVMGDISPFGWCEIFAARKQPAPFAEEKTS